MMKYTKVCLALFLGYFFILTSVPAYSVETKREYYSTKKINSELIKDLNIRPKTTRRKCRQ